MARTAAFSFGIGLLFAWNWGRLEDPSTGIGPMLLMVVLGVLPALLPTFRWRIAGASLALLLAGASALDVARPWSIGRIAARAGRGFLDFYDVLVPFDGAAHPLMHGVIQLAVFLFTALAALAIAARRPVLAGLVVVAGAGWPATIMPGGDDLGRGAFVLAAVLALVAWLQPEEGRRAPPQILVGFGIIVAALVVSSSGAVAKGQFIGWENWDFYNEPGKPVEVGYVWRSNYDGIDFPKDRTRVFTVKAPPRSTYWRATTLDVFSDDRWDEEPYPLYTDATANPVLLTDDPPLPASARNRSGWARADVTIDALRDEHLVGPSQPVQYDAREIDDVQYQLGGTAVAFRPPGRGAEYTVWGYTPQPRPAKLAESSANYPPEIAFGGRYLSLPRGFYVPTFRSPEYAGWAATYFRDTPDGRRYRPLYDVATRVAGRARNPYAAAVALEAWFRSAGGFVYDEHPPRARGAAPLVQFVTDTKRGYCQHFAGAMALMLRYLGIPARVAAGFTSGVYDKEREQWAVYDRDAHTWVEVWFDGFGWLPFDPTPGRGTLGGPYTVSSVQFDRSGADGVLFASALRRDLLRGNLGREGLTPNTPQNESAPSAAQGAKDEGRGSGVAGLVVLAVLVAALLFVLIKLGLRRSRYLTQDPRRTAAACRSELVEYLRDQRIDVPASIGTRELGELLGTRIGVNATGFADALGRARYGPLSRAREAAQDARREVKAVRRGLRRAIPPGRRFRGLFSLRSLLAS
ncbi:MAG TPA: transglutaminase domain-containing protein [Gaiellaceae bacterium]|nr:transglutaminase domain-containing protein [Gaiellaceae bacterium]